MKYYYKPGHPKANKNGFVSAVDFQAHEESLALHAPVLAGRFYENTSATDGTDIGSRKKHREYMKSKGLAMVSDFSGDWNRAEKERQSIRSGEVDRRERREQVERALYQKFRP